MNIESLIDTLKELQQASWLATALRVSFLLVVCLPLLAVLGPWLRRWVAKRWSAQRGMLAGKALQYIGVAVIFISVLHELGFSLAPLLGAAGILGIALGFASQTSVSNVISGLFMIAERSFEVGHIITVEQFTGVVESIDVLSVKIRTFDNHLVRIPNETMVKSTMRNISFFPIRRIDVIVGVAYKEDLEKVFQVIRDVAAKNPYCLDHPAPLLLIDKFNSSSIDILVGVWSVQANFLTLKNTIQHDIHKRFKAENIEIPFPHLSLYTGSATAPFPLGGQE